MPRSKVKRVLKEVTIPGTEEVKNVYTADANEMARLTSAINDFKYDIGIAADTDQRNFFKRRDAGRIINNLSNILFKRGLLPKELEGDFRYIKDQLGF